MANTTFQLRRSSVAGKVPNTSTLSIGELGLNLTDQILYSSNGTGVFELGANVTNQTVKTSLLIGNSSVNTTINSSSISVSSIVANGSVGTDGQVLTSNGSTTYWSTSTGGGGTQLIKQQYTANGTQSEFTVTGGYTSNNLQVYLNGVLLRNGVEANVQSGSTFTISPTPSNGSLIDVYGISTLYANGVSTVVSQQFTANGTANSFTITNGYIPNQIQVFLNGVKQVPSVDIDVSSGSTVNFVVTPANGYVVDVYGYQTSVSYYSNNLIVGNVSIGTDTISVGNSSVNTQIVAGNVFLNGSTLVVGNTSTNVTINSTSVSIGANNLTVGTSLYAVSNGNVGIGTSSPSFKLHVDGGSGIAVYGVSTSQAGVYGLSSSFVGTYGISNSNIGVYGISNTSHGLYGTSYSNWACYARSATTHGVVGVTGVGGGIGVYALNEASGCYTYCAYSSYGIYTNGNIYCSGSLSKGSGSFNIPHPLPELSETHRLIHSFVESPTADNIYRGKIQLQNGQATVNIDTHVGMTEGTFSAVNGNIQVFLQNDSGWDLVRGSVTDNILTIISQNQSSTDTISWMVIGERQDQHMLDTQWTDEFGRPILEPLKESEPDVALPPEPGVPNENG